MKYRFGLVCAVALLCSACDQPNRSANTGSQAAVAENTDTETQLVSFQVEGMTCPSGCYPTVRSAIAKQKGVVDVELAPQQKEDVIDNPTVFVKYKGKLDLDATFKAIERVGFEPKKL